MLCFLDDGAGMDPSKLFMTVSFAEFNNLLLKLLFCDLTIVARRSTWGIRSLLRHLRLNYSVFAGSCPNIGDV